jgi:hypothetical protein
MNPSASRTDKRRNPLMQRLHDCTRCVKDYAAGGCSIAARCRRETHPGGEFFLSWRQPFVGCLLVLPGGSFPYLHSIADEISGARCGHHTRGGESTQMTPVFITFLSRDTLPSCFPPPPSHDVVKATHVSHLCRATLLSSPRPWTGINFLIVLLDRYDERRGMWGWW